MVPPASLPRRSWRMAASTTTPTDAASTTTPMDTALSTRPTGDPSTIPTPVMPHAPPPASSQPPPMPPPPPPPCRANSDTPPPVAALLGASGSTAATALGVEEMDVDPPQGDDSDDEGGCGGIPTRFPSPLQRQLRALTPDARESRQGRLERMSEWELVREGNMAKNKELLSTIGVSAAVAGLMAEVRAAVKRKPEGAAETARGKRAKRRGDDEDDEEYGSGEDEDENDRASREGTPTPSVRRGGARGGGGGRARGGGAAGQKGGGKNKGRASQLTVEEEGGVPKWAADAQVNLLRGGGGDVWVGVVNMWWEREKANKFQGPVRAFLADTNLLE
ncbi:hypothetical protein C8F04DRAFT_1274119 [Mycena alexandri]|uniref:Uncharacterized protein n=1 Tax=Mycena alexandri TaxID=1745969 RepID=A0AAD6WNI1_9AGAR|nr:hypothetical protein C8F04DRAFT_1274119 [Mycena alexandri]